MGLASLQTGRTASAPLATQRGISARQPFTNLSPNGSGNYTGYGLSAGVKISHQTASAQSNSLGGRPMVKSRGRIIWNNSPYTMLICYSCAETKLVGVHRRSGPHLWISIWRHHLRPKQWIQLILIKKLVLLLLLLSSTNSFRCL